MNFGTSALISIYVDFKTRNLVGRVGTVGEKTDANLVAEVAAENFLHAENELSNLFDCELAELKLPLRPNSSIPGE